MLFRSGGADEEGIGSGWGAEMERWGCCLKLSLLSSKKGSGWGVDRGADRGVEGDRSEERKGSGVGSGYDQ